MPVIILFDPCYELSNDVKRLIHGQKIRFDVLSARNVYASIFFFRKDVLDVSIL